MIEVGASKIGISVDSRLCERLMLQPFSLNRTAVGSSQPSTSLILLGFEDVDARDKRGHDDSIQADHGLAPRVL